MGRERRLRFKYICNRVREGNGVHDVHLMQYIWVEDLFPNHSPPNHRYAIGHTFDLGQMVLIRTNERSRKSINFLIVSYLSN